MKTKMEIEREVLRLALDTGATMENIHDYMMWMLDSPSPVWRVTLGDGRTVDAGAVDVLDLRDAHGITAIAPATQASPAE